VTDSVRLYDNTYMHFATEVLAQVRAETFGEDIGQNSWLTADEYRKFFEWLRLSPTSNVLDVGSGSGGPSLFLARTVGCQVVGIDENESGIANSRRMATEQRLDGRVSFHHADAASTLQFEDRSFDAIISIDAINHLRNRLLVLRDWHRLLKPAGRLLFTDPITVTGMITRDEVAIRSKIGHFVFTPRGEDERLIQEAGFELLRCEDLTENAARVSKRWNDARESRRDELIGIEGEDGFEEVQQFLAVAHQLSSERRLSRFAYLARKRAGQI